MAGGERDPFGRRDAGAIILDSHDRRFQARRGADGDDPAIIGQSFKSVAEQIVQDLPQPVMVNLGDQGPGAGLEVEADVVVLG